MSTDLEQRLHDALRVRARDAAPWPAGGASLRRTAAERRARLLRAGTVAGVTAAVLAVVAGVSLAAHRSVDPTPPAGGTSTATPTFTRQDGSPFQVAVSDTVVDQVRNDLALGDAKLAASVTLPGSGRTALLFIEKQAASSPTRVIAYTVTWTARRHWLARLPRSATVSP